MRSGRCSTTPAGLFEKSRVVTAGISIGQIEKRELDPRTRRRPRSRSASRPTSCSTRTPWWRRSRRRCSASIYLEIDPGTPRKVVDGQVKEMRKLKDGDQIKNVIEPVELGEMMPASGR